MSEKYVPLFIWDEAISPEYVKVKLTGKCPQCGHFHWLLPFVTSDGTKIKRSFLKIDRNAFFECEKCRYRVRLCTQNGETNKPDIVQIENAEFNYSIDSSIHILEKESERVRTSSETVLVPAGVKITVKRSRTVEHTVDVSWGDLKGGSLDLGIKDFFGISIKSEIEKKRGRSYKESETIEYEVELNGDKVSQYNLVWADIWCKGFIEITINNTTQMLPFRFRDSSELEVIPVEKQ